MNTPSLALAACTTLLLAAAGAAHAQEATLFPHALPNLLQPAASDNDTDTQRIVITGRRGPTRDMVLAQLAQAIADGSLDRGGEASAMPASPPGTMSRAEVVAELMLAKAEGRFDNSGEHWIGHDHGGRDPSFARAAVNTVLLAKAR